MWQKRNPLRLVSTNICDLTVTWRADLPSSALLGQMKDNMWLQNAWHTGPESVKPSCDSWSTTICVFSLMTNHGSWGIELWTLAFKYHIFLLMSISLIQKAQSHCTLRNQGLHLRARALRKIKSFWAVWQLIMQRAVSKMLPPTRYEIFLESSFL